MVKRNDNHLPEKPNDFKIMQKDAEKMGYFDLWKYVNKIQAEGYDATRYLVDLHGKAGLSFRNIDSGINRHFVFDSFRKAKEVQCKV